MINVVDYFVPVTWDFTSIILVLIVYIMVGVVAVCLLAITYDLVMGYRIRRDPRTSFTEEEVALHEGVLTNLLSEIPGVKSIKADFYHLQRITLRFQYLDSELIYELSYGNIDLADAGYADTIRRYVYGSICPRTHENMRRVGRVLRLSLAYHLDDTHDVPQTIVDYLNKRFSYPHGSHWHQERHTSISTIPVYSKSSVSDVHYWYVRSLEGSHIEGDKLERLRSKITIPPD